MKLYFNKYAAENNGFQWQQKHTDALIGAGIGAALGLGIPALFGGGDDDNEEENGSNFPGLLLGGIGGAAAGYFGGEHIRKFWDDWQKKLKQPPPGAVWKTVVRDEAGQVQTQALVPAGNPGPVIARKEFLQMPRQQLYRSQSSDPERERSIQEEAAKLRQQFNSAPANKSQNVNFSVKNPEQVGQWVRSFLLPSGNMGSNFSIGDELIQSARTDYTLPHIVELNKLTGMVFDPRQSRVTPAAGYHHLLTSAMADTLTNLVNSGALRPDFVPEVWARFAKASPVERYHLIHLMRAYGAQQ